MMSEQPRDNSEPQDDTAIWSLRHLQVLWTWAARPAPAPYPAISSIPRTSVARLSEHDASPRPFPSEPVLAKEFPQDAPVKPKTVLYLAYGSNMSAETFLGMRGIRPLSQVNVSAPSLDLTFDLPGIPYREPCFANTAPRKLPGKPPKFPPELPNPPMPPSTAANETAGEDKGRGQVAWAGSQWNKGLYGVVYEVTTEDYAKIIATEGGGAGYHDILVPCLILPPSVSVPEKPTIPVPPRPFLAHTLYAPRLPDVPDDGDDNGRGNGNGNGSEIENHNCADERRRPPPPQQQAPPRWLARLLTPVRRPDPDYAQPSARYLKLLRDGAREHELPADYQAHLASLQPYTATTCRQRLGQVLFLGVFAPMMVLVMLSSRVFADERGRSPAWLVALSTVVMNLVWWSYDAVGKRVFGDGERTVEDGDINAGDEGVRRRRRRRSSIASALRGSEELVDEEKTCLLDTYQ